MLKLILTISAFIIMSAPAVFSQNKTPKGNPKKYVIEKNELSLVDAINKYRSQKGRGELQLSLSLSFVAYTHLNDIRLNSKDMHGCNQNSWSGKGKWIPCCFDGKQTSLDLMTSKPSEIIGFRSKGYEIVITAKKGVSNKDVEKLWLTTKATQDFILNKGQWTNRNWQCMGVSIYKGFASIWVSDKPDRISDLAFEKEMAKISDADLSETIIEAEQPFMESKGTCYFLVHSSYTSIQNAANTIESLKKEGFKNLVMIDTRGKYRVALGIYTTEAAAKVALRKNYPRFDQLKIYNF